MPDRDEGVTREDPAQKDLEKKLDQAATNELGQELRKFFQTPAGGRYIERTKPGVSLASIADYSDAQLAVFYFGPTKVHELVRNIIRFGGSEKEDRWAHIDCNIITPMRHAQRDLDDPIESKRMHRVYKKSRALLGALRNKDEKALIDMLNRAEYELALAQESFLVANVDRGDDLGDAWAKYLSYELAQMQTGTRYEVAVSQVQSGALDRFGLRNLSRVELEHLREETQTEVDRLQARVRRHIGESEYRNDFVKAALADFSNFLIANPDDFQIFVRKKLLSETKLQLKRLAEKPAGADPNTERVKRDQKWSKIDALKAERDERCLQITDPDEKAARMRFYDQLIHKEMEKL